MPRIREGRVSVYILDRHARSFLLKLPGNRGIPALQRALFPALVICAALGCWSSPVEIHTRVIQEELPWLTPQETGNQTGPEKDKDCK